MAGARKATITKYHQEEQYKPRNKKEELLAEAFTRIKDKTEMAAFLRDLMTLPEIEEFSNRLEMARLLLEGESYLAIAKKVGVSTSTVTRVSHWLFSGCGGYQGVLKKK